MPDGRIEKGKATRERLIAIGRLLFGKFGYVNMSIEKLLAEAGVAKGAVYHHFSEKQAFFEAIVEATAGDAAHRIGEAVRGCDDPLDYVRATCHALLAMARDPAIQRILILDPPAALGWKRGRQLDEIHVLGRLRAGLQRLADEGGLPEDQVDVLAHMLLAAINEAALLIEASEKPKTLAAAHAAVDTLLDRLIGRTPTRATLPS